MKNYDGAVAILNMLDQNGTQFSEKETAQLENMACRMIRPRPAKSLLQKCKDFIAKEWKRRDQDATSIAIPTIKFIRKEMNWSLYDAKMWHDKNVRHLTRREIL